MVRIGAQESPRLTILLLTEDSSKQAGPTIEAISRHLLELATGVRYDDRVEFQPVQGTGAADAVKGNYWQSTKPLGDMKRRALVREIAATLLQDRGFVLFHIDADRTWSESCEGQRVPNVDKFRKLILPAVERAIRETLSARKRGQRTRGRQRKSSRQTSSAPQGAAPPVPTNTPSMLLGKLILLVPTTASSPGCTRTPMRQSRSVS